MKTKQLVIDAMLAAVVAVLGYLAIDLLNIKITFETLPIFIGACLFGPVDGMAIGGVGTFVYQILRYGFSVTTVLWILPYIIGGFIVGLVAKKKHFAMTMPQTLTAVIITELLITLLNTGVIYIDSVIYGYYYPGIILGVLAIRIGVCVVKAAAFGVLIPYILRPVKKSLAIRT